MATLKPPAIGDTPSNVYPHSTMAAALNADIQSLTTFKDMVQDATVKEVFESVIAILTLIRDREEQIEYDSLAELTKFCSRMCHVLETTDDLGGLSETIKNMGRTVRTTESAVRRWVNRTHDSKGHNPNSIEECIIAWRAGLFEIQRVFDEYRCQLTAAHPFQEGLERGGIPVHVADAEPPAPAPVIVITTDEQNPDENFAIVSQVSQPPPMHSRVPLPPPQGETNLVSDPPPISDSDRRALQRLISGTVPQDELVPLIESIVSNVKAANIVEFLQESDVQKFIDVMDRALDDLDFTPKIRSKCVRSLYKMCAGHTTLPRSLHFELPMNAMDDVQYHGGFADILRCECSGRKVAVKALRPQGLGLPEMRNVLPGGHHLEIPPTSNVLSLVGVVMTENRFAMVSEWMTNGNINQFTKAHPDANRFGLLADVAKGLNHMHSQRMVHGDLKGENILINQTGHACLADFGLLTIASDATGVTCSHTFLEGGTDRWMSPELFDPEEFELKDGRPTKGSDCYALGMVIYEVLSGQKPYSGYKGRAIGVRILKGERPVRPRGAEGRWFTDDIWSILDCCWKRCPGDRPRVEDVLRCLEVSRSWTPPQVVADPPTTDTSARKLDSSSEESTNEGQLYSPSAARSRPLRVSLSEAHVHRVTDSHDLIEDTRYLNGSDPEGFVADPDRALSVHYLSQGASLKRRTAHGHQEGSLLQSNLAAGQLEGRPFVMPGTFDTVYRQKFDAEDREPYSIP